MQIKGFKTTGQESQTYAISADANMIFGLNSLLGGNLDNLLDYLSHQYCIKNKPNGGSSSKPTTPIYVDTISEYPVLRFGINGEYVGVNRIADAQIDTLFPS